MKNKGVAKLLYEIADLLEIKGVEWKPRAYRKAAQNIEELPVDIKGVYKKGELDKVPGVGEGIAEKISEFLKTGRSIYLAKLKKEIPIDVEKLLDIPEIGPKTVKLLYKELKIKNISDLKKAAKQGKIAELYGMGKKTEKEILESLGGSKKRFLLKDMLPTIKKIENILKKLNYIQQIVVAGSVRRQKKTIHDADILVASNNPKKVTEFFTKMKDVKKVLAKGPTRSSVLLKNGFQVDIRIVKKDYFGAALLYFTGSKQHNIKLRKIAIKKGLKLSEYGVFKNNKFVAGKTEKEVYNKLGLKYIEPELREDTGEIEKALIR